MVKWKLRDLYYNTSANPFLVFWNQKKPLDAINIEQAEYKSSPFQSGRFPQIITSRVCSIMKVIGLRRSEERRVEKQDFLIFFGQRRPRIEYGG